MDALKVYIISDSLGQTGETILKAAMAQFKTDNYKVKRHAHIDNIDKLEKVLKKAAISSIEENILIIYTLVDKKLIDIIRDFNRVFEISTIDLLSPLINVLSTKLKNKPLRESGTIRKLDAAYFSRVAAIEFAVKYDDGKDPRGFLEADLVLIGVSRTSKTPLSMYLSNKNIKVANLPLVNEVKPPKEIFEIPRKRIIGLTNSPEKLNEIREVRLKSLGLKENSNYASMSRILDELEYAERIMKKIGCPVIDVSNKAIEETADNVISLLNKNGISFE